MARKKTKSAAAGDPSFEEAMAGLEEIVAAMEEEELPLEELVEKYETGTRLLKRCEEVLRSAKKKIRTIAEDRDAGGDNESLTDGSEAEGIDAGDAGSAGDSGDSGEDADDDDIRLF